MKLGLAVLACLVGLSTQQRFFNGYPHAASSEYVPAYPSEQVIFLKFNFLVYLSLIKYNVWSMVWQSEHRQFAPSRGTT